MARLLDKSIKPKLSKSEAAGVALTKLRLKGNLTIPEAADYLGVHKYTVREYIDNGFIQTFKIGTRQVIEEDELRRVKGEMGKWGGLARAMKEANRDAND